MDNLLREFLAETIESLDVVDTELVKFKLEPNSARILDNIFRLVHTIKGTSSFLGLTRLEAISHEAESLMDRFRGGAPVTSKALALVMQHVDQIKSMIAEMEKIETRSSSQERYTPVGQNEVATLHPATKKNAGKRRQPVAMLWQGLEDFTQQLAQNLGKQARLILTGTDTHIELDRHSMNIVKTALIHMLRNAVDHGLETPQERLSLGKPETGEIRLSAFYKNRHIIIKVADDGRGLDAALIKHMVLQKNLSDKAKLEKMSARQIQDFIFAAGLSTAKSLSHISGCGAGLDAVRADVEGLSGKIEVNSSWGQGTAFTLKIPRTVAATCPSEK